MRSKMLLALPLIAVALPARAVTVNLGFDGTAGQRGNVGGWVVTAAGAVKQTPYNVYNGRYLVLSSDAFNSGTPVPGATPAAFDGFAAFTTTFNLPANATGVTLSYSGVRVDDRALFELNGQLLRATGVNAGATPTPATFVYSAGGSEQPAVYQADASNTYGVISGTDTGFFNLGGANTLTFLVNATYNGIYNAGTPDGLIHGDFKGTFIGGDNSAISVSYTTNTIPTPEPASMVLFGLAVGAAGLAAGKRRRG